MSSLKPDIEAFLISANNLQSLNENIGELNIEYQKIVAEITLLRLFDILQNLIISTAEKIACGTQYLDGTPPILLIRPVASRNAAKKQFRLLNRPREINWSWGSASDINENIRYVISKEDNYYRVINYHSSTLSEIRKIRNRIAHNNRASRDKYREVVNRIYGAYLNTITPGRLLISRRDSGTTPLNRYTKATIICAREMVKKGA